MVHGYDAHAHFTSDWGRRGRTIIPKILVKAAPAVIRNVRERSLGVRGAHIFNLLPEKLRSTNCGHVDMLFKNHFYIFLSSISDKSTVTGLGRAADSNSLLHHFTTDRLFEFLLFV